MEKKNATEILNILNNQWAGTKEIRQIGMVGETMALNIKREIATQLEKEGYRLPPRLVPMEKVVDYFKININYLKKLERG